MLDSMRDMDQAVYALLQLYEGTEVRKTDDLALYDGTDCILLFCAVPRVVLRQLRLSEIFLVSGS